MTLAPLLFMTIPLAGGVIPQMLFSALPKTVYKQLAKPSWSPPAWVFGPVWTYLYISMGYAAYLVWSTAGGQASAPLHMFCAQMLLNWMWSPVFTGMQDMGLALAIIIALWGTVAATTVTFLTQSRLAGYLMIPYYLVWLTLAASLNWHIYQLQ